MSRRHVDAPFDPYEPPTTDENETASRHSDPRFGPVVDPDPYRCRWCGIRSHHISADDLCPACQTEYDVLADNNPTLRIHHKD